MLRNTFIDITMLYLHKEKDPTSVGRIAHSWFYFLENPTPVKRILPLLVNSLWANLFRQSDLLRIWCTVEPKSVLNLNPNVNLIIWDIMLKQERKKVLKSIHLPGKCIPPNSFVPLLRWIIVPNFRFTIRFSFRIDLGSKVYRVPKTCEVSTALERRVVLMDRSQIPQVEKVMDYRTFCCAIAALVQKPSLQDFPLKQGREQSPEIHIPSR